MNRPVLETIDIHGAKLSRRGVLASGGALVVSLGLLPDGAAASSNTLDPASLSSWIEIGADNTVLIRTGKSDFGQGSIFTAYRQIVAEELDLPFEAITRVVSADTDRTPDGGGTFGFLGDVNGEGMPNLRKVAAYTRQALLELAARRLAVARDQLSVTDGVVSGGGRQIRYGELVKDQNLKLTIPVRGQISGFMGLAVEGNPPMKPVASYKVIGKSFKNSAIVSKVTATEMWVTNIKLPGMLHARMVHPATLGSTLVSAGQIDKAKFPNSQVIVKGNLVGVVAPDEWEAIQAARQVAASTKWSDWKGLPGQADLFRHLRTEADWKSAIVTRGEKNKGDPALPTAAKTFAASYELPYIKHAPIGPTMALADVRSDGSVTVHTHTQNAQQLRAQIAQMLGIGPDKVVVRTYAGAGHYGRSNGGNAGGEDAAVILSKELGRPVRVQWMRADDMQWSTQSPAATSDVKIGLEAGGKIVAYQVDHYMPAMQDDRLIGAVLAGLPTMRAPGDKDTPPGGNTLYDPWVYDSVLNLEERGHSTWQIGQRESPVAAGLRAHAMRTPGQYQQNFPREAAISEAAALAGADAIQFRIDHAKEERLISVLERLRTESGWETRPAPQPHAASTGENPVRGQGVSVMFRSGTYWACACRIAVAPTTGAVVVEKVTVVVDPGIVVNPLQLKRQVEGGTMMGVSEALYEEVAFDQSGVTSRDWQSYPILKMADMPEVKVVLLHRPEVGTYGGGSEAANALASPAIAAAFHDATGKPVRRLPLRPAYMKQLLTA
jgi:CO/xanthine dehydrogenase Mo-binding subunit